MIVTDKKYELRTIEAFGEKMENLGHIIFHKDGTISSDIEGSSIPKFEDITNSTYVVNEDSITLKHNKLPEKRFNVISKKGENLKLKCLINKCFLFSAFDTIELSECED